MEITTENTVLDNEISECFIKVLSRLKESSLEAVESSKKLSPLTQYMHVERPVQKVFDSIIKSAVESDKAELILLCGSVGDGKSHMLSYYNDNFPEMMKAFQIHNDSTASFYINKSAIHTIREVLDDFADNRIASSRKKLILAINLGTLNNFIEADKEDKFGSLKSYINKNGILKETTSDIVDSVEDNFHCVNFTDYHLYNLSADTPKSAYIDSLVCKLVSNSNENIFMNEYKKCCLNCVSKDVCPIKGNYDMLTNPIIRESLIQIIIESIVKNKLIISTRALLNLIYEIIVDERYINTGSVEPRKDIKKLSQINYCKSLMPNSIFSRMESSTTINAMRELDPLNVRNDRIDTFVVEYTNKDDILDLFESMLPEGKKYLLKFSGINFEEYSSATLKQEILKLFIRMYRLFGKEEIFDTKDATYQSYMKNLYYWNSGEKLQLRNAYTLVKQGALHWNGNADNEAMIVPTNNVQTKYSISQKVDIKQSLENVKDKGKTEIERFSNVMYMDFTNQKSSSMFEIEVDYALYDLLSKIVNGYRPNMKDKSLNVKFTNFVDKISHIGSKDEVIYIQEKTAIKENHYKLEYSPDFGYTFEVV